MVPKYNFCDMDQIGRNSLKKALDLVRAGKYDRARPILIELLKDHPTAEQAWFLLSYTLPEGNRQIYALQQALKVNPDYQRARDRLASLRGQTGGGAGSVAYIFEQQAPEADPAPAFFADEYRQEFGDEDPSPEFEAELQPKRRGLRIFVSVVVFVILVTAAYLLTGDWVAQQLAGLTLSRPAAATATEVVAFRELPPTWTPTAALATATQIPSPTSTPQAFNFAAPNEQILARMDGIQQEVLAIRGLSGVEGAPRYIVSRSDALAVLEGIYLSEQSAEESTRQEQALTELGLIPADYRLIDYKISSQVDQQGGFYTPQYQSIFLIGEDFSGLAPFFFTHEYQHALIDRNFDLGNELPASGCPPLSDACRAVRALVEGDASYLSAQWLENFADSDVVTAAQDYATGQMLLQAQLPPPFVPLDLAFPYDQGSGFAQALVDLGGWERLDQVYKLPPTTTEQILHPEKYLAGEGAAALEAVDLAPALSAEWQPVLDGSMGEWLIYLLLSQGADVDAQQPDDVARAAAAGWGADTIQFYSHDNGSLLLAADYIWDSEDDAAEWQAAMQPYLDARYAVAASDFRGGQCWQTDAVAACIFLAGGHTLWLQGPDLDLLGGVFSLYAAFQ